MLRHKPSRSYATKQNEKLVYLLLLFRNVFYTLFNKSIKLCIFLYCLKPYWLACILSHNHTSFQSNPVLPNPFSFLVVSPRSSTSSKIASSTFANTICPSFLPFLILYGLSLKLINGIFISPL